MKSYSKKHQQYEAQMHMKKREPPNSSEKQQRTTSCKLVTIRVGEHFFSRVENHVRTLKYINKLYPKKKEWIAKAIHEKLDREHKEKSFQEESKGIPRTKHINVELDLQINEDLEKRINVIKKVRSGFSKKQWILEAIMEKLELEEAGAQLRAEKIHTKS